MEKNTNSCNHTFPKLTVSARINIDLSNPELPARTASPYAISGQADNRGNLIVTCIYCNETRSYPWPVVRFLLEPDALDSAFQDDVLWNFEKFGADMAVTRDKLKQDFEANIESIINTKKKLQTELREAQENFWKMRREHQAYKQYVVETLKEIIECQSNTQAEPNDPIDMDDTGIFPSVCSPESPKPSELGLNMSGQKMDGGPTRKTGKGVTLSLPWIVWITFYAMLTCIAIQSLLD